MQPSIGEGRSHFSSLQVLINYLVWIDKIRKYLSNVGRPSSFETTAKTGKNTHNDGQATKKDERQAQIIHGAPPASFKFFRGGVQNGWLDCWNGFDRLVRIPN